MKKKHHMTKLDPDNLHELQVERTGKNTMYLVLDGVRVAKRGRPGTKDAKTWVPLVEGIEAKDIYEGDEHHIEIYFNKRLIPIGPGSNQVH